MNLTKSLSSLFVHSWSFVWQVVVIVNLFIGLIDLLYLFISGVKLSLELLVVELLRLGAFGLIKLSLFLLLSGNLFAMGFLGIGQLLFVLLGAFLLSSNSVLAIMLDKLNVIASLHDVITPHFQGALDPAQDLAQDN